MKYAYTLEELKVLFIEKGEEITNKKGEKCYIFEEITPDNYKTYPFHICYYHILPYDGKISVGESYHNIRYNKTRDILEAEQVSKWVPFKQDKHCFLIKDVNAIEHFKNEFKKSLSPEQKKEYKLEIKKEIRHLIRERKQNEKKLKNIQVKINKLTTIYNSIKD